MRQYRHHRRAALGRFFWGMLLVFSGCANLLYPPDGANPWAIPIFCWTFGVALLVRSFQMYAQYNYYCRVWYDLKVREEKVEAKAEIEVPKQGEGYKAEGKMNGATKDRLEQYVESRRDSIETPPNLSRPRQNTFTAEELAEQFAGEEIRVGTVSLGTAEQLANNGG